MPKRPPRRARVTKPSVKKRCAISHGLTQREDEILFWVSRGKSNAQIAEILGISPGTVSKHLEHIYPKLGVENRTAAASFARPGSDLNLKQ